MLNFFISGKKDSNKLDWNFSWRFFHRLFLALFLRTFFLSFSILFQLMHSELYVVWRRKVDGMLTNNFFSISSNTLPWGYRTHESIVHFEHSNKDWHATVTKKRFLSGESCYSLSLHLIYHIHLKGIQISKGYYWRTKNVICLLLFGGDLLFQGKCEKVKL